MRKMRERRVITLAVQADPTNATLMDSYTAALGRPARKATVLWQNAADTATLEVNDYVRNHTPNEEEADTSVNVPVGSTSMSMAAFTGQIVNGPIYSLRLSAEGVAVGSTVDVLVE